jgi:uncharacterized RDD family membrane protein YckC
LARRVFERIRRGTVNRSIAQFVVEEGLMHCSSCGAQTAEGTAFCRACGKPIIGYTVAPSGAAPYAGGGVGAAPAMAGASGRAYAGFWLRFVAYVIDSLVMGAVVGIVVAIAVGFLGLEYFRELAQGMVPRADQPNPVFPAMLIVCIFTLVIFALLVSWLYHAGMESSENQATLGKMALGLVVTDMNGQRISFARATGRFFSKIITSLVPLYIGFIMAGFTEKRQALHDMIASCLVLRKV